MNWSKLQKKKHQGPGAKNLQHALSGTQLKEQISSIALAAEPVRSEQASDFSGCHQHLYCSTPAIWDKLEGQQN